MKSSVADFNSRLLHPRFWLSWAGVAVLVPVSWLPCKSRHWLGQRFGMLLYRHNAKRRRVVQANLRLCLPQLQEDERDQLSKQCFQYYGKALLDYSILFFRSRYWLHRQLVIKGSEHIDSALAQGQNVVLLLGHSVWLEFAPLALGQHYQTYGSYKPFPNPVLNWMIARSRLKDVSEVIAREAGMIKLVRSLKPGKLLFFLPDEDHGLKNSVFAPFFGVPKATLNTPARIAKMSKAQCLPVIAFFNAKTRKYQIEIGAALPDFGHHDGTTDAKLMNQGFEQLIRQFPAQYMWQLKLFRTRQPGKAKVY